MRRAKALLLLLVAILGLSGCQAAPGLAATGSSDFFVDHKDTKVGNNSGVRAIIDHLDWENIVDKISLSTRAKPYGITINFTAHGTKNADGSGSFQSFPLNSPATIANAGYILALVENADWVEMTIPPHPCPPWFHCSFTNRVERSELEQFFGRPLSSFATESELKAALATIPEPSADIFNYYYKSIMLGDIDGITAIINHLDWAGAAVEEIELVTNRTPMGIVITLSQDIPSKLKFENAGYLMAFVFSANFVQFNRQIPDGVLPDGYDEYRQKITRAEVEKALGVELGTTVFASEAELKQALAAIP